MVVNVIFLGIGENIGKLDPKFDLGIFLGFSTKSEAYRLYN